MTKYLYRICPRCKDNLGVVVPDPPEPKRIEQKAASSLEGKEGGYRPEPDARHEMKSRLPGDFSSAATLAVANMPCGRYRNLRRWLHEDYGVTTHTS